VQLLLIDEKPLKVLWQTQTIDSISLTEKCQFNLHMFPLFLSIVTMINSTCLH